MLFIQLSHASLQLMDIALKVVLLFFEHSNILTVASVSPSELIILNFNLSRFYLDLQFFLF